jgi:hypothetical protein
MAIVAAASLRLSSSFAPHVSSSIKSNTSSSRLFLLDKLFGTSVQNSKYPIYCDESVMSEKKHGTSEKPVQSNLRWNCDFNTADRICNFVRSFLCGTSHVYAINADVFSDTSAFFSFQNRHYAEYAGYWQTTDFLKYVKENYKEGESEPIKFYDSVTGKLLFQAPIGRSMNDFLKESQKHGWPSFRDEECVWDDVRCLKNGECVSTTGTHLGHNLVSDLT